MEDVSIKEITGRYTVETQLLEIWEKSVCATHHFLSKSEIAMIKSYVPSALQDVQHLIVAAVDTIPMAFMGIEKDAIAMLFVTPSAIGNGIGGQLVTYSVEKYAVSKVTVNEQNPAAVAFYKHMGFTVVGRSELDEQGNPYPILYMIRHLTNFSDDHT